MTDLEAATTEDLLAELKRRHTALVIAVIRDDEEEPDCEEVRVEYSGSPTLCLGLVERAHMRLRLETVSEDEE